METILVGYDDSDLSRRALERAASLASSLGGRLVVLSVAEVALSPELPATDEFLDLVPISIETAEPPDVEAAQAYARELIESRGIEADFVWAAGEPAATLLDVAEQRHVDLIVIGSHHESLLERLFGASVADEVTHGAGCDVLVVR